MVRARPHHNAALCMLLPLLAGCIGKYHASERLTLDAEPPVAILAFENYLGDCVIRADPNARGVHAEVELIGRGPTQADADLSLRQIAVLLEPRHGTRPPIIAATADHPPNTHWQQHEVRWIVTAPPDVVVRAKNVVGALEVTGFHRGAFLETGAGSIRVRALIGGLTLVTAEGSADIQAAGRVDLRIDAGNATLDLAPQTPADIAIRVRAGKINVHLPADRQGILSAESTLSQVRINSAGRDLGRVAKTENRFECRLGRKATPRIDLISELGEITIDFNSDPNAPESH